MPELVGQTVVVTGAAHGIGRCIAGTLARDGARVALADILEDEVRAAARELVAHGHDVMSVVVDVADAASAHAMVAAVLERFGRVDALVNNAGIDAPAGLAWEIDEAHWRRILDVDLSGAWWCTQAVLPAMMEQRAGRIVFISSVAARLAGDGDTSPAYATAKAGLIGLTVALSAQLEPHGILVNAIAPGPTGNTGSPYSAAGHQAYRDAHALGFGGPQPIADGVRYLLAGSGDWVSGAVLNISGGLLRGL